MKKLSVGNEIKESDLKLDFENILFDDFSKFGFSIFELNIILLTSSGDNEEGIVNDYSFDKL